jgi:hypothetical protein
MSTKVGISTQEAEFLSLSQSIGMSGLLILRRLRFFGITCTTTETDLATHVGKSVASIKRYLGKLVACDLITVESRRRDAAGTWLPNRYTLKQKAVEFLQKFAPWLMPEPQVRGREEVKTSSLQVSYGEPEVVNIGGRPYEVFRRQIGNDKETLPTAVSPSPMDKPLKMFNLQC